MCKFTKKGLIERKMEIFVDMWLFFGGEYASNTIFTIVIFFVENYARQLLFLLSETPA